MLTDRQIKLIVGSLLHDIGKVVYRSGDGRNHSASGCDYLKNDAKITDLENIYPMQTLKKMIWHILHILQIM